jgi:hypothetical protein
MGAERGGYSIVRLCAVLETRYTNGSIPGKKLHGFPAAQGWQSLFATESGDSFRTGNSVASAEQTSAAPFSPLAISSETILHFLVRLYTPFTRLV